MEYQPKTAPLDLTLEKGIEPIREVYAAAHIVASPDYKFEPGRAAAAGDIDWEATLAYRTCLWNLGFGVAEAMDTAQRGGETGWDVASILLENTLTAAKEDPANRAVIGGAGADLVKDSDSCSLSEVIDSYVQQINFIRERGGAAIIFPNDILPKRFPDRKNYEEFLRGVMANVDGPVYLHWLGAAFNPNMANYWGFEDIDEAAKEVVVPLMERYNPLGRGVGESYIAGIKLSTLDPLFEEGLRKDIREFGQVVLTGDDLNFPELIAGKDRYRAEGKTWSPGRGRTYPLGDYSHALLGIFDGIAPVAAKALQYLAKGNREQYDKLMEGTVPLSRRIFSMGSPPLASNYKAGLVFLAYLNGHQDHFKLLGGIEEKVDVSYLTETFILADQAGVLGNPQDAYERFRPVLRKAGYEV
ncbi:MAG: DUF993 family protein [Planctomycetota bacterium]